MFMETGTHGSLALSPITVKILLQIIVKPESVFSNAAFNPVFSFVRWYQADRREKCTV